MNSAALSVIENLEKASDQELETIAGALFAADFSAASSDKAPFIWAALSLYWAQMASLIPGKARAEYGAVSSVPCAPACRFPVWYTLALLKGYGICTAIYAKVNGTWYVLSAVTANRVAICTTDQSTVNRRLLRRKVAATVAPI